MTNYFMLRKILKLIKYSFRDWLFYLILLDVILTLVIVYTWIWYEANPIVVKLWYTKRILITFWVYYLCSMLWYKRLIWYILLIWYIFVNLLHIYQIFIFLF